MRCYIFNTHVKSRELNNLYTSDSANATGKSNQSCINVHTKSSFNTLITLQKETNI